MEHLTLFFYYIKGEISGNYISDIPDMLPLALSHLASPLLQHIGKAGFNITAHSECRNHFEPLKEQVWRNSHYFLLFYLVYVSGAEITHLTYKKLVYIVLHWMIPPSKPYIKQDKQSSNQNFTVYSSRR